MKQEVFWKNPKYRERPFLRENLNCQYLIVGGGVTGVSLAYFLQKAGVKDIVLLEKDIIAGGATGKAAGILTPHAELDVVEMFEKLGKKKGLLWYHSSLDALHLMKHIVREEKIHCDYEEEPTYYAALRGQDVYKVFKEYNVLKKDYHRTQFLLSSQLRQGLYSPVVSKEVVIFQGASINPLAYTQELSLHLGRRVRVYEQSPVLIIKGNIALTPQGSVRFRRLIDVRDYASSVRGIQRCLTTVIVTDRLTRRQLAALEHHGKFIFLDAKKNCDYLKVTKDGRLLAGFGDMRSSTFKGKVYLPHVKHLKSEIKRLFPHLDAKIAYAWSAHLGVTKNYLPHVLFDQKKIVLAGTSSQVVSTLLAQYTANRLMGKKQALDIIFK